MKKYSEYKDSGVKWIGEIPKDWTIRRTRFLCDICTGDKDTVMREDNGIYPFYVRSPKVERINSYSYDGEAILMAGDGVGAGKVFHYANGKFDYHQRVYNLHNIKKVVSGKFFFYFIRDQFHYAMEENNAKSTVDSVRLPWLKAFPVALPPLPEQQAIVSYLDDKVAKIDKYIAVAEKKIKALEELKQTIISDAVTHGINPDVKMKDSGIKWVNQVPVHWDVKRVAIVFSENKTKNTAYEFDHALKFNYGTLIPKGEKGDVSELKDTYMAYTIIDKDDIAINCLNLNYDFVSQRVAICPQKGILTSAYLIITPRKGVCPMFFNYLFKAMDSKKLFHGMGTGIRLTLSFNELKRQYIPIPPLPEQRAIVSYIDRKVSQIDQLRQKEQSQIEKLKEYKQRLISDVVTGKVKVTND